MSAPSDPSPPRDETGAAAMAHAGDGTPRPRRPPPTARRQQLWKVVGSGVATIAAAITILAFVTGVQSVPEWLGGASGDPADARGGTQSSGADTAGDEGENDDGPGSNDSGNDASSEAPIDPPATTPVVDPAAATASIQAVGLQNRLYDVDVAITAVRVVNDQTHVRLSLTNRGPQPIGYVYSLTNDLSHPSEWRIDRFRLSVDDGAMRESVGQQGLVDQLLANARHTCLDLPAGASGTFTVIFDGASEGDVATVRHPPHPRLPGFGRCEGNPVALPSFELRAAIERD